jgi:hypothetical protein
MSKRKRDEGVVSVNDAIASIASAAGTWTDPCGVLLYITSKMVNKRDRVLYQLLEFDTLTCKNMQRLVDLNLPGDFCIESMFAVASTKSIDITIIRNTAERAPSVIQHHADLTEELVRLRIANVVAKEDIDSVRKNVAQLLRMLPSSTSWTVINQNDVYIVRFMKVSQLGIQAITMASRISPEAAYDFENATLNAFLRKTQPLIVH